jgi:hypothetical protein
VPEILTFLPLVTDSRKRRDHAHVGIDGLAKERNEVDRKKVDTHNIDYMRLVFTLT